MIHAFIYLYSPRELASFLEIQSEKVLQILGTLLLNPRCRKGALIYKGEAIVLERNRPIEACRSASSQKGIHDIGTEELLGSLLVFQ